MATFELYEDAAGEHRWRLVSGGEIIADGGEGYASRSGARAAVERVAAYAPDADVLDVDPTAFEVYQDRAGAWRWRLRHRNGNVLADGGEGYSSRSAAREAVERVGERSGDAEIEER